MDMLDESRKPRPAQDPATEMDANPSAVLAAYGHTMLVWQILEQHLGQLWVMNLVGEHQLATDQSVRKGLRRSIHAAAGGQLPNYSGVSRTTSIITCTAKSTRRSSGATSSFTATYVSACAAASRAVTS